MIIIISLNFELIRYVPCRPIFYVDSKSIQGEFLVKERTYIAIAQLGWLVESASLGVYMR